MRDMLLAGIVVALCLAALMRPRIGLYGYLWFGLMLPDVLAYTYGKRPYSMMLAVATLVGSIRYLPRIGVLLSNPIVLLFLGLQVPLIVSTFAAVDVSLSLPYYQQFLQTSVMVLLIPLLVTTVDEFRSLLLVMGLSLGFLGTKIGVWALAGGGIRVISGPGGFISENNTLALALAMTVPLCWHARGMVRQWWMQWGLLGVSLATIATIIMTHSRSGILTLGGVLLLLFWRSRHKVFAFAALAMISIVSIYMVRETLLSRMATIQTPTEEMSAANRLDRQMVGLRIARDNLLVGVGFGAMNFAKLSVSYTTVDKQELVAHNNYIQMLVDSGILALVLFCVLLFGTIYWLGKSAERFRNRADPLDDYPTAVRISLIAFAIGSTFASRTFYDFIYMLLMTGAAWYQIEPSLLKERQAKPAPASPGQEQPGEDGERKASSPAAPRRLAPGTSRFRWEPLGPGGRRGPS